MILTIAVLVALVGALVFEGRVIVLCLLAFRSGGEARLTALGSRFLASEVWVVALLGLAHGAYADLLHVLMGAGAAFAVVYVAGWMLRDLCLWMGPRLGPASLARGGASIGAGLQLVGVIGFVAASLTVLPRAAEAAVLPTSDSLLAYVAIPVIFIGCALQYALMKLPPAPYFSWGQRRDPFVV